MTKEGLNKKYRWRQDPPTASAYVRGAASYALTSYMEGEECWVPVPRTADDLAAVINILADKPHWRARMPELVEANPAWAAILTSWPRFCRLGRLFSSQNSRFTLTAHARNVLLDRAIMRTRRRVVPRQPITTERFLAAVAKVQHGQGRAGYLRPRSLRAPEM